MVPVRPFIHALDPAAVFHGLHLVRCGFLVAWRFDGMPGNAHAHRDVLERPYTVGAGGGTPLEPPPPPPPSFQSPYLRGGGRMGLPWQRN